MCHLNRRCGSVWSVAALDDVLAEVACARGERDAIIAATAGREADQHREAFAESAADLERVRATVEDRDDYEPAVFTR